MAIYNLDEKELDHLDAVLADLNKCFSYSEISAKEIPNLIHSLESDEVADYLTDLQDGSQPEAALREELTAGQSIFTKYIFGKLSPEVTTSNGYVDYKVRGDHPIQLELKSAFRQKKDSNGDIVSLNLDDLNWEDHKNQVEKYRNDNKFTILTNLRQWYFFSNKDEEPINDEPLQLREFIDRFKVGRNINDYLIRYKSSQSKPGLDEEFLNSLNEWVDKIEDTNFAADKEGQDRTDEIVNLINKFIFIQTLDDYAIVEFNWIESTWQYHEQRWKHINKKKVLTDFLKDVTEWFYAYYDTELFRHGVTGQIPDDGVNEFYDAFAEILGLNEYQENTTNKGITNYDYREIDEDIFGKAYEQYLAEVRKEQSIYYTPGYISEHLVASTIGEDLQDLRKEIVRSIEEKNEEQALEAAQEFSNTTVLDPMCGSGSFLVKAFRVISEEYNLLFEDIRDMRKSQLSIPSEARKENSNQMKLQVEGSDVISTIDKIRSILGDPSYSENTEVNNQRNLTSKIILRHIHGNDFDARALEIAKLNIWLESVKLNPESYRYDNVPESEGFILPDLELNLSCGNGLVGLPIEHTIEYLNQNHSDEISDILHLREEYINNPTRQQLIGEIVEIIENINKNLNEEFESYLSDKKVSTSVLDQTPPLHWPLQFWHVFCDRQQRFDYIVGNPPWKTEENEVLKEYLYNEFDHLQDKPDLYRCLIERALELGDQTIGLVTPNTWFSIPSAAPLRDFVLSETKIKEVLFVPNNAFEDVSQNIVSFKLSHEESTHQNISVGNIDKNGNVELLRTIPEGDMNDENLSINLYVGEEEKDTVEQMEIGAKSLYEIADSWHGYQLYHNQLYDKDIRKKRKHHPTENKTNSHVQDTRTEDIDKYYIEENTGKYVDTSVDFWRLPPKKFFKNDKILMKEAISNKQMIAARSRNTRVFPKSIISIVPEDEELDINHLLALLNSRPLYLQMLVKSEKAGQDLFPRSSLSSVEDLSIKGTTELAPYSEEMEALTNLKKHYMKYWEKHRQQLSNDIVSLSELLEFNREMIQNGNLDQTWFESVSFYPSQDNDMLRKSISEFTFTASNSEPIIEIYSVNGSSREKIFKIITIDRDLTKIIYLGLVDLSKSRKRIESLEDVLDKCEIYTIRPNTNEKSKNIVKMIEHDLDNELSIEEDLQTDIIQVDDRIDTLNNKIDAEILNIYGLGITEYDILMKRFELPRETRGQILEFFLPNCIQRGVQTGKSLKRLLSSYNRSDC